MCQWPRPKGPGLCEAYAKGSLREKEAAPQTESPTGLWRKNNLHPTLGNLNTLKGADIPLHTKVWSPLSEEGMETQKYIYWQDGNMFLGYLEAYPDYWTQGETLAALEENLLDLYTELTSGIIPCVRKVAELKIA